MTESKPNESPLSEPRRPNGPSMRLEQLATARSGDKGNHANIGVVAFNERGYDLLRQWLTAERVGEFFQALGATGVERFELPRALSFNFVLYNALAGGASRSLRIDTQGKLLGTAILQLPLPELGMSPEAAAPAKKTPEPSAPATKPSAPATKQAEDT